jgi:hypothetical protein
MTEADGALRLRLLPTSNLALNRQRLTFKCLCSVDRQQIATDSCCKLGRDLGDAAAYH